MSTRRKPKATKAQTMLRLVEIIRIRLDGAQIYDVTEYVVEKEQEDGSPWKLAEGEKPLSRRQVERYVQRADEVIAESTRVSRKRSLIKHLARREAMYARAMNAGDVRTALAVLDSEAKLRGLFDTPAHPAKLNPPKTPQDTMQLVASVIVDLRAGRLDNKTATTLAGLAGSWLRSLETTELEQRLAALEAAEEERRPSRNGRF